MTLANGTVSERHGVQRGARTQNTIVAVEHRPSLGRTRRTPEGTVSLPPPSYLSQKTFVLRAQLLFGSDPSICNFGFHKSSVVRPRKMEFPGLPIK